MLKSGDGCLLRVRVRPRAAQDRMEGIHGDSLKVSLTAAPSEGAANEACLRFLATQLGLPRSRLSLRSGHRSRQKLVAIPEYTPQQIQERLNSLLGLPGKDHSFRSATDRSTRSGR
ncbi:MAG: DUF167 domain-containing protein [candidate division NC10 bacterium]|nr:DUF167 domain-containing protein [candidate division NC10 bacterium]